METITTRGRSVEIPSWVEEMNPAQYRYLLMLSAAVTRGVIDAGYMRVRLMSYLIGMGDADYTVLLPEHAAELEGQLDRLRGFFREDNPDAPMLSTPVNLMPEYKGHKGPGDWLDGMTFGEFTECLTLLEQLQAMEPEESGAACRRVASLMYRLPEDLEPDTALVHHSVTLLSSVWEAIQHGPVEINGRTLDFSIIFRSSGSRKPDDRTGWTGVTFEVASAGLFGNVREVEKCDLWEVLLYLYRCRFEQIHTQNNK